MNSVPHSSGIYKIVCIPTGKIYVGSSENLRRRWSSHKRLLKTSHHPNPYLQSAWDKYGEAAFTFEIIELVMPWSVLDREQYWLDKLKPYDRKIGFNACLNAKSPMKGRKHTIETKKHMGVKGRQSGMKGKKHTAESRGMMGKSAKLFMVTDPNGQEIRVLSLDKFCKEHNLDSSHLIKVARGIRKHYKGWVCRYA
jgi:group I intron endonuclease